MLCRLRFAGERHTDLVPLLGCQGVAAFSHQFETPPAPVWILPVRRHQGRLNRPQPFAHGFRPRWVRPPAAVRFRRLDRIRAVRVGVFHHVGGKATRFLNNLDVREVLA